MTRAEEIAAALERWEEDSQSHITDVVRQAGHGVARLLRESQETPGERLKRIADETDEADFENERTDYE